MDFRFEIVGDIILKAYDNLKWKVAQPVKFIIGNKEIEIPEGFETDLASVPKILWSFCPPFGKYTSAAILHDFMYSEYCTDPIISREVADKLFLLIMDKHGVSGGLRKAMYRAVRLAGEGHFEKDKVNGKQPLDCEKEALIDHSRDRMYYISVVNSQFGFELLK